MKSRRKKFFLLEFEKSIRRLVTLFFPLSFHIMLGYPPSLATPPLFFEFSKMEPGYPPFLWRFMQVFRSMRLLITNTTHRFWYKKYQTQSKHEKYFQHQNNNQFLQCFYYEYKEKSVGKIFNFFFEKLSLATPPSIRQKFSEGGGSQA